MRAEPKRLNVIRPSLASSLYIVLVDRTERGVYGAKEQGTKGASEPGEPDDTGRRVFSYSPLVFSFYSLSRRSWYTHRTLGFSSMLFHIKYSAWIGFGTWKAIGGRKWFYVYRQTVPMERGRGRKGGL